MDFGVSGCAVFSWSILSMRHQLHLWYHVTQHMASRHLWLRRSFQYWSLSQKASNGCQALQTIRRRFYAFIFWFSPSTCSLWPWSPPPLGSRSLFLLGRCTVFFPVAFLAPHASSGASSCSLVLQLIVLSSVDCTRSQLYWASIAKLYFEALNPSWISCYLWWVVSCQLLSFPGPT